MITNREKGYAWRVENLVTAEVVYAHTRSEILETAKIMQSQTPNTCIIYLGQGDYIVAERKKNA